MLSHSRIEGLEAFLKEVVVSPKIIHSFAHWGESGRAAGNAGERFFEAFQGFVGGEPVLGLEKGDERAELGAQPFGTAVKELVGLFNKVGDGAGMILAPVLVEKVVEKNVDDNTRESSPMGSEQWLGVVKDSMVIGEAVNATMHHDSVDDGSGQSFEQGGGGSFLKVAQDITNARGVVGTGQGEMSEEVHFLESR